MAQDGLLIGEASACDPAGDSPASPVLSPLTHIGVVTCDRTATLRRACVSYVENARAAGRSPELRIADDSRSPACRAANADELRAIPGASDGKVCYADRARRTAVAARIAAISGVADEIVSYALVGDTRQTCSIGANRNALLLASVGERSISVDDDTVCVMVPHPAPSAGISICAEREVNDFWFYPSRADIWKTSKPRDRDFLGDHDAVLGRSLPEILGRAGSPELLDMPSVCEHVMQSMRRRRGSVALTFHGILGDSGMPSAAGYLCGLPDRSRERLLADENMYRSALRSRQILKVVERTTIYHGPLCMATTMGLDAAEMLPPFPPVGRNEDGAFGCLVSLCMPERFSAHLPWAVLHAAEEREYPGDLASAVHRPRLNEILMVLVAAGAPIPVITAPEERLAWIARSLQAFANLPSTTFEYALRWELTRRIGDWITGFEEEHARRVDAPAYWRRDVETLVDGLRRQAGDPTSVVPLDGPCDMTDAESVEWVRENVRAFGELLFAWPAIWRAAATLKLEGWHVFEPIG